MERQGDEANWQNFYALVGRYVVSAGNAESWMFRLLLVIQQKAGLPQTQTAPQWNGLIDSLLKASEGTAFDTRVGNLLHGAKRRGRIRNNIVHAAWFSATDEAYWSRRHFGYKGGRSAMLLHQRADLEQSLQTMEWFEDQLEHLAQDVQAGSGAS